MPRDRSLDEFLSAESDAEGDTGGKDEPDMEPAAEPDEGTTRSSEDSAEEDGVVDPKETTYGWSPDGGVCTACGEPVDARWRDDGDLVCVDCKDW